MPRASGVAQLRELVRKTQHRLGKGALPRRVAAVPYKLVGAEPVFRLVKTSGGRWTFPKGRLEADLSEREAAEQEAWQEGGVRGVVDPSPFTSYLHERQERKRGGKEFLVDAYLMEVSHEEQPQELGRDPEWSSAADAVEKVRVGRDLKHQKELERVIAVADEIVRARVGARVPS